MKENLIHSRTSVYNINYHMVWSVKYRRKVITPVIEAEIKQWSKEIGDEIKEKVDEIRKQREYIDEKIEKIKK